MSISNRLAPPSMLRSLSLKLALPCHVPLPINMAWGPFEVLHKSSKHLHKSFEDTVSDAVLFEMRDIVMDAALPVEQGESVKVRIARASRRLGLSFSRVRTFWYGTARTVHAHEADRLRAAHLEILDRKLASLDADRAALRARLDSLRDGSGMAVDSGGSIPTGGAMASPCRPVAQSSQAGMN